MNKYRIFETNEFLRKIEKLDSLSKEFIRKKLLAYIYPQIKFEPFFGKNIKKLKGYKIDTWRYRIGNFRIFYNVEQQEKIIYMLTVDDRKKVYKNK